MKVLVAIGLNKLSSLHIPSRHMTLFTVSYFLSEILRIPDVSYFLSEILGIPDNGRNQKCRDFLLF